VTIKGTVGTYAARVAGNERFPCDVTLTPEGTANVDVGAAVQKTAALAAPAGSAFRARARARVTVAAVPGELPDAESLAL